MNAQEREDQRRDFEQTSGAEVPGFHARTVIDDTIGKLYALRKQIAHPMPEGLAALLDDIEALTEQAIDLGIDPDAPEITQESDTSAPERLHRYCGGKLGASGSDAFSYCSCGGVFL